MSAGAEKHIVTEQGGITVKIPAGVSPGKRIRVRGKGRLDASTQQQGNLYLLIVQRGLTKEEQQIEVERKQNEQDKQERERQERIKREVAEKQRQAEEEEKQRRKAEQLRQQRAAEAESSRLKQQEQLKREADKKRQEQARQPSPDALKGNYADLEAWLKAGKWQEADLETAKQMCLVMGRQEEVWLRVEDIKQFPCADLRAIDHLWVRYSNGRFGFSVQKKIWQQCGSPAEYNKQWEKLGEAVGWKSKGLMGIGAMWKGYCEFYGLTFDTSAPEGHLPVAYGLSVGNWNGNQYLCKYLDDKDNIKNIISLYSRAQACCL